MATWTVRDQEALGLNPVAYAQGANGERVEIFLGDRSIVYLRLILGAGFETFSESNCPTFQVDVRKPMHHFEVGYRCAIVAKRATYLLGRIIDKEITSLVLHRFMNGNQVSFRYSVKNGQYRQTTFSLGSSKLALTRALGSDTRILVE
ncbi:MAG: hypothetical protein VCB07_04925 [Gammaproteobacteria bacterium]